MACELREMPGLGGEDFLRDLVQRTVQQVLEAEMTGFLGAETCQRNDVRRGWRNGYKPRTLKTRVGELELMVPKDRDGQFQTELFERYQRSEKAFVLALLQMYVEGVSTRKVSAPCCCPTGCVLGRGDALWWPCPVWPPWIQVLSFSWLCRGWGAQDTVGHPPRNPNHIMNVR
jgi:hypothetical protein